MRMKEEGGRVGNEQKMKQAGCTCAFPHVCIVILLLWYSWGEAKGQDP